jgi:predicted nucleic acid-binding protein
MADPKLVGLLQTQVGAVCGITRAEVLHGVRTPAERHNALTLLNTLVQLPIPDALWDAVGDNLAALRAAGVTVPFPDVVLATLAIANNIELWTRDKHFAFIQGVLPALRLFQEPP